MFFWSDEQVWWKFHIHSQSKWARGADPEFERRRSMNMIAYPILYALLVLPQSIIRWLGFVQENTGRHINTIPFAATFTGRVIYGLSGICNVILFLKTRPHLLLMTPPAPLYNQSSSTISYRRRGENDRFAHSGSLSLENGNHWVDEDLAPSVEGYERAPSDGSASIPSPKVVRGSSFMELEVRLPTRQGS